MILLLEMPYTPVTYPSLVLGLIQSELTAMSLACTSLYPCMDWLKRVGKQAYQSILYSMAEHQVGEWVFARAAFGSASADEEEFLDFLEAKAGLSRDWLFGIREQVEFFLDELLEDLVARQPRIVLCNSTHRQQTAALAVFRRLKARCPEVHTVLVGTHCEGSMGVVLVRNFECLDYVISGDPDRLVGPFCQSLLEGTPRRPFGVFSKDPKSWTEGPDGAPARASFTAMERVVTPNFDDYFRTVQSNGLDILPGISLETARGCWWGQKHPCTFCGLNGGSMNYRVKSKERALEEFEYLSQRYQVSSLLVMDKILDMGHLKSLLPVLAERQPPLNLYYDVKSNLSREQVFLLAKAGVRWMQPGAESFTDELLHMMDKGTTGLQNIQLIRNSREAGISLVWNYLVCFPGENDDWHGEVSHWIPWLHHLQPPLGMAPIRYDRYSPYQMRPQDYDIHVQAARAYRSVYPLQGAELDDLAMYFQDHEERPLNPGRILPGPGKRALYIAIKEWREIHQSDRFPRLHMLEEGEELVVTDTRAVAVAERQTFVGRARQLLLDCQSPRRQDADDPVLQDLVARKLILGDKGRFLSLPHLGLVPNLPSRWTYPVGSLDRPEHVPAYLAENYQLQY